MEEAKGEIKLDFSKKISFDILSLLKYTLIIVSIGAMFTLYQPGFAWIVIVGAMCLAVYEISSMYHAYNAQKKKKSQEGKKK